VDKIDFSSPYVKVILKHNNKYNNPFYDNHVFTIEDLERIKLTWFDKVLLIFKPMYHQFGDGVEVRYKTDSLGRYYIFSIKENNDGH